MTGEARRNPRQRRVTSTEARIVARLDALRRNRGSQEQLGQLIQEELDRTPVVNGRSCSTTSNAGWTGSARSFWRSGRRRAAWFNSRLAYSLAATARDRNPITYRNQTNSN